MLRPLQPTAAFVRTSYRQRGQTKDPRVNPPKMDFLLFHARQTSRSHFVDFVSVGRGTNNDIVVNDDSVSKFHAFFRRNDKHFFLNDAGSANGTLCNEKAAPEKNREGLLVSSFDRIDFGNVRFTLLEVDEFVRMARGQSRHSFAT